MPTFDASTLQAALVGYNAALDRINANMSAIRKQLGGHAIRAVAGFQRAKPKHKMSTAGRRAIAAAQKKRWTQYRAQQRAAASSAHKVAPKRKLSPERKAALVANLAKARAAKSAKAVAATA
jgi:hypothetical protein